MEAVPEDADGLHRVPPSVRHAGAEGGLALRYLGAPSTRPALCSIVVSEMSRPGRDHTDRYAAGSARIQELWQSTEAPREPNRAMTWLRTAWATGRPVGPPVLDEVRRTDRDLEIDLLNAAFRHFPAGDDTPMEADAGDRHLCLVRGDFESPFPGHVLSKVGVYPDGAIVTSECVAGDAMEHGEPHDIERLRLYGAMLHAMLGVLEIWRILDKSIVAERPVFDIRLSNVGRRALGVKHRPGWGRPFPIAECPEDPVCVLDAPKEWLLSEGEEIRGLAEQLVSVVDKKFRRWGDRREGHPFFGEGR